MGKHHQWTNGWLLGFPYNVKSIRRKHIWICILSIVIDARVLEDDEAF